MSSADEMKKMRDSVMKGETPPEPEQPDVPENFKTWVAENRDRIAAAAARGKTPWFVLENEKYFKNMNLTPRGIKPDFLKNNTNFAGSKADEMQSTNTARIKELRNWAKENLHGRMVSHPEFAEAIHFTGTGIKEFLNQPHKNFYAKNELLKRIDTVIQKSKLVGHAPDVKGNTNIHFYYLETNVEDQRSYIVIKHTRHNNRYALYSIVDKIKNR
jgi:hypothetical protein